MTVVPRLVPKTAIARQPRETMPSMFKSILHSRYKAAYRTLVFLIAASFSLAMGAISVSVVPNSSTVGQYDIYELTLTHSGSYSNPWDDIGISAIFTAPSGKTYNVGGFYYDTNTWKIRFAPMETGTWRWSLTFDNGSGTYSNSGTFTCMASSNAGFLRLNPAAPQTGLITEKKGAAFYPLGIQLSVYDGTTYPAQNGTPDGLIDFWLGGEPPVNPVTADQYFSTLASAGFNLYRHNAQTSSLIQSGAFNIGGGGKNNYHIQNGKLVDQAVRTAHQYGWHFMLAFMEDPTYYAPNFDLSNSSIKAALLRYHQYQINRYGAYIDIWELMNEKSGVPDSYFATVVSYIRQNDPYRHLVTTSHVPTSSTAQSYLDINAPHQYESVDNTQLDYDLVYATYGVNWRRNIFLNRPLIWGEQGNKKPICNYDPERFRMFLWANFFNQAYPIFWDQSYSKTYCGGLANMYVGTEERAIAKVFTGSLKNFDPLAQPLSVKVNLTSDVRGYALGSATDIGAYFVHSSSHTSTLSGATTTLTVPANNMQAEWIDPTTGAVIRTQGLNQGSQTLSIPPFVVDIALRIRGAGGPVANPCDLNGDSAVDVLDVQIAINQTLGKSACGKSDLDSDGTCDVVDVQREVNAALGASCRVGP